MKKFYILFISFLILSRFASAQWEWIHPLPQGNDINCMSFLMAGNGFAGTAKGIVLKTDNGGNSWTKHYTGRYEEITGMHFSSFNSGCLIQKEYFLVSADSGVTWTTRYRFADLFGDELQFLNQDTGWISGEFTGSYKLVYTSNGGTTFQTLYNSNSKVTGFYFLPGGKGWLSVANGDLRITVNYGQNWTLIPAVNSTGFNAIHFTDSINGYACADNGEIYSSADGGLTWNSIPNPASFSGIIYHSVYAYNQDTVFVSGTDGFAVRSADAGLNWSVIAQPGWFSGDVIESAGGELYLGGTDGEIRKSIDQGVVWTTTVNNIAGGSDLNGATHDQSAAWYFCGEGGTILNYSNSSLTVQNSGVTENLFGISFGDPGNGICVGEAGKVLRTINAGFTWNPVSSNTSSTLKSISRAGSTLYATGENETVIKSVDDGITWNVVSTPVAGFGYTFETVQFIHPDTGFIFTDQLDLLTTTDGGTQWNFYSVNSIGSITGGLFLDATNGWVCTNANEVYHTTDGGANWNLLFQHNQSGIHSRILFLSQNEGFVWGDGYVLHTRDGGNYWSEEYLPFTKKVNAVINDGNKFLVAGAGSGSILNRFESCAFQVPQDTLCMDNSYPGSNTYAGPLPSRNGVIQLSDENGDFYNPAVVGQTSTGQASFSFTVPTGIPDQSGYRLRAVFENPPLISDVSDAKTILYAPDAQLFAAGPTVFCPGDSVILFATGSPTGVYSWYVNNVLIPNVQGDVLTVYTTGDYTVQVVDGLCTSVSQIIDVVVSCTGIAEMSKSGIRIYPNPAGDLVNVEWPAADPAARVDLRDISGRMLFTRHSTTGSCTVPLHGYAPGIYLIEVETEQNLRYMMRVMHP